MDWSMNWECRINVSVQCLPYLIKAMKLMEHVKTVVLNLARSQCSCSFERKGWLAYPPVYPDLW